MIVWVENPKVKLDPGFLRSMEKLSSLSQWDKNFESYTDMATVTHPGRGFSVTLCARGLPSNPREPLKAWEDPTD